MLFFHKLGIFLFGILLNNEVQEPCTNATIVNRMQKVLKLLRRANDENNFNRETEEFMASSHISNVSSHDRIAQQEVIDVCLMLVQQDIA